jgi:4-amino-4-deoxy-L-arabinose transferase-like glycosyltransferase
MKKKKKLFKQVSKKAVEKVSEFKSILPSLAVLIMFGIWAAVVISNYFKKFPMAIRRFEDVFFLMNPIAFISGISHQFVPIVISLWLIAVSLGVGLFLLKYLKVLSQDSDERFIFSIGVGLIFLTYLSFGFGLVGLFYKSVFYASLLALTVVLFFQLKEEKLSFKPAIKWSVSNIILLLTLSIILFINFAMSLSPELFYDSLVYHLAIPQYYILHHKIINMPQVFFSHFPVNMSMLYVWGLLLSGDILAKLLHFFMGVFSIVCIYIFSKKYFNSATGIMAAAIFYTMPMVAMCSWSTGTELALTFYQLLGFWAIYNYFYAENRSIKWLALSGVFSGMACAIKYTGVFSLVAIIILLIIKLYTEKASLKDIAKKVIIVGFVSTLLLSPTLIKNFVYTKNPVHPYLSSVFGRVAMSADKVKILMSETKKRGDFKFGEYLKLPWKQAMQGNSSESFPGFVFLLFLPLLFIFRKVPEKIKYLIAYFVLTYLMWSSISYFLRYFMPGLAFLSLIIAYFLINNSFNKHLKNILIALAVFAVGVNLYWSVVLTNMKDKAPVITGVESRDNYLSRTHAGWPSPYYKTVKYINKNLPEDARVLFIGEHRGFHSKRVFIAGSVHDDAMILRWTRDCKNENDLYDILVKEKITHILVSLREGIRVQNYNVYNWRAEEIKIFDRFWKKHIKELTVKDDVFLYQLVDSKAKEKSPINTVFVMYAHKLFYELEGRSFDKQILETKNILRDSPEIKTLYRQASIKFPFVAYFDGLKNLALMEYSENHKRNALQYMQVAIKQRPDQKKYRELYLKFQRK